ncbi:hypothetical protein [Thomasclavelia cocleata]|uniref:hypothetical protein n=1 Tax=Thomasclavelia cocleata TaxID=69824 RepID=UPI00272D25EA|nr:hypothetical protein [Thomasclavelia cocleata]
MHDFVYVTKKSTQPVKNELIQIIQEVQNIVRPYFTFQPKSVGSSSMNMITYDRKSNIGFDFDFDLAINDDDENYSPGEIRNIMRNAIDQVAPRYGYKHCEDSTRVLTIKKVNTFTSQIIHSCDFALVYNCKDGRQQYIRFNKKNGNYTWEYQGKGFRNLDNKIAWLKHNEYWIELQNYYIDKKNSNDNPDKHSRSILAESINEMYQKKKN